MLTYLVADDETLENGEKSGNFLNRKLVATLIIYFGKFLSNLMGQTYGTTFSTRVFGRASECIETYDDAD